MNKRKSIPVKVGTVIIGGDNPIAVQSMTDTQTADISATVRQIKELAEAGSELVRITVNTEDAAKAVPKIKEQMIKARIKTPLIGDFHYNGHSLLSKYTDCANSLDKFRINPGNVNSSDNEYFFKTIIELAIKHNKPVRIGVNSGSLDKKLLNHLMDKNAKSSSPKASKEIFLETMAQSALNSAKQAIDLGLPENKIILSAKSTDVQDLITVTRRLSEQSNHALHIGLTEAGMGDKGITAAVAATAVLLHQGIGDTIRVSITPKPGDARTREVQICQYILQTMGFRYFRPLVSSCPGCGRTSGDRYRKIAELVNQHIEKNIREWKEKYPGVEQLKIAVMGCVVNGIGEASNADIGLHLPGKTEAPIAPVYANGKQIALLKGENIAEEFCDILNQYIKDNC